MKHSCRLFLILSACIIFIFALHSNVIAQEASNIRMQRAVAKFMANQKDGSQIVAVGSWVDKNGTYADILSEKGGTSDHDMRFVPKPGASETEAIEQWKNARNQLRTQIIDEFGAADAEKILANTNLYAPSEAMLGVEDAKTAAKRFAEFDAVPTLAHSGPVNHQVAVKYSEGLYGEGTTAWKQIYETKKGRAFYNYNGKAYSGLTDLVHASEGFGRFTSKGMGHTTTQWIEHAADELRKGDARALVKQLKRVDDDLHKGFDLARLGSDANYRNEIQSLITDLNKPGANVAEFTDRVNEVLRRGQFEAEILKRIDDVGLKERAVLKTVLKSAESNGKAWKAIKKVASKVPYGAVLDGLMASAALYSVADTSMNRSDAEAIAKLIPDLAGVAPGILVEIADSCMEEAKVTGYVMVANRQDALDLIAGIYTARGREQGFERTGKKYDIESIDQLVRQYRTRRKLEAFVRVRAEQAAARDAGVETKKVDKKVAQAIYDKCFPYLLHHWLEKRDEYRREYIRLLNKLRITPLILVYSPNPAKITKENNTVEILLEAKYIGVDMVAVRNRMRELLQILTEDGIYIDTRIEFSAKGRKGSAPRTFRVWAKKTGVYTTSVTITDDCGAAKLGDAGISAQRVLRTASVEVPVELDSSKIVGVTGYCRGTYQGKFLKAPPGTSFSGGLNRKGWVNFRITGTSVKGSHIGENGKSILTGTYNPETKSIMANATTTLVGTETYTLSGTYSAESQTFSGTYTGVYKHHKTGHKTTESGTWTAQGKLSALKGSQKK